jgi:hypothetical protein
MAQSSCIGYCCWNIKEVVLAKNKIGRPNIASSNKNDSGEDSISSMDNIVNNVDYGTDGVDWESDDWKRRQCHGCH